MGNLKLILSLYIEYIKKINIVMNSDIFKKYTPIKITNLDFICIKQYDEYYLLFKAHNLFNIYYILNRCHDIVEIIFNYEQYNQKSYYIYLKTERIISKNISGCFINNYRYGGSNKKKKNNIKFFYNPHFKEQIIAKTIYLTKFYINWYCIEDTKNNYDNLFSIYKKYINNNLYFLKSKTNNNFKFNYLYIRNYSNLIF